MDLNPLHRLIAQTCAACELLIESGQFLMRADAMHFHVDCLYLWDVARQALAGAAGPEHAARP